MQQQLWRPQWQERTSDTHPRSPLKLTSPPATSSPVFFVAFFQGFLSFPLQPGSIVPPPQSLHLITFSRHPFTVNAWDICDCEALRETRDTSRSWKWHDLALFCSCVRMSCYFTSKNFWTLLFFLWGYALPISNAVHVYFSGFPLFSAGDLNKRSIFFMRDYLKFFFFFSYGGGVKTTTSTASPWMRISAACDVCTMYIVLFIETECENIFSLVWGEKKILC